MADFKDERAYNSRTLTKVFLGSSVALLLCVVFMAWRDYNRPWKDYERKFMQLQRVKFKEKRVEAKSAIDRAQLVQLTRDLKQADADLKSRRGDIARLQEEEARLDARIYKTNSDFQVKKAEVDSAKFDYSENYVKRGKDNAGLKKKIDGLIAGVDSLSQQLFQMRQKRDQDDKDLDAITSVKDALTVKIKKTRKDYDDLSDKIQSLSFDWLFYLRNAMLLDFMSPTYEIKQVMLTNLPDDMYFTKTMRVDRCMTCHLAIDKKGWEDMPQPFRTHPKLDLYVGSASSHSMNKVGCTVCHGGSGDSLDFNTCGHMPGDEDQAKRWRKKFNWREPEDMNEPMLPLKFTEGYCLKCHSTQEQVNFAPKLDRGRYLMAVRGCLGCHKVKNMETLPKAGPSLVRLKGKLRKEFVKKWVWNPKSFNPEARMPSFFQQTNNSDPESAAKNQAELECAVEYLYDRSGDYKPEASAPAGSVTRGKKLLKEAGCLACHGINDVTSHHADFAPDLSGAGSKLSPSFIYTWVRDPKHYDPETRMPSLRLTDAEAADITAYLSSKRNPGFEKAQAPSSDPAVRDALLVDYLTPFQGKDGARESLAKLDDKARTLLLGEKTIGKYACFACHMIKGFENAQRIGTDLSDWGQKQPSRLDFGYTAVPHDRISFLNAKLSDPRQFDKGRVVDFRDRLKMPNFYLSEDDREAVMTAVLGLTTTYVPDEMTAGIHGSGPLLEKGRRVVSKFNCRGCHLVEDQGGLIREMYAKEGMDFSLAPPNLRKEGAKVQIPWLRDFLTNVHSIRPWLHIRMPSFQWSDEDLSDLITYFNVKDDQVFPFKTVRVKPLAGSDLAEARAMFTKLQCQKCHVLGASIPPDLNSAAPDLLKVHQRLKPEWVVDWLRNPEDLMPGTRMPGFWPQEGGSSFKYFHGDASKQREALRDYLFMMGSR